MRWYNRLFDKLGHRRLMTREEFWSQVRRDVTRGDLRVLPKRQHELLLDIAALADIVTRSSKEIEYEAALTAAQRLRQTVMKYKIVEQDENIPPSTNGREVRLMEIS